MILLRGIDEHDAVPRADKPIVTRRESMIERWFIVGTDDNGQQRLLANDPSDTWRPWRTWSRISIHGSDFSFGLFHRYHQDYFSIYALESRDQACAALSTIKKALVKTSIGGACASSLSQSARIVRVRRWSKGERAKTACDRAGIQTLENGNQREAAQRLGLSHDAARKRFQRALGRLREHLASSLSHSDLAGRVCLPTNRMNRPEEPTA